MIQLLRSSIGGTGTALFGSSIMHNDIIRLTISNGFIEREDSQNRYYAKTSRKKCIVEVDCEFSKRYRIVQHIEKARPRNEEYYQMRLELEKEIREQKVDSYQITPQNIKYNFE